MEWLEYLESNNISFNIYILETNDSFVFYKKLQKKPLIIVLYGLVKLINIFTNGEIICTKLLHKYDIIPFNVINSYQEPNNYYKAKAIIKTAILAIPTNNFGYYRKHKKTLPKYFSRFFLHFTQLSPCNTRTMTQILCHRNTKKRIAHLLLLLAKEFGHIQDQTILIPFYISHNNIGIITGSQRVNVTRIMNYFKNEDIISYKKQYIIIRNLLKLIQA